MKSLNFIGILIFALNFNVFSQNSDVIPEHVNWIADKQEWSLKIGFEKGIPEPEELCLQLIFPSDYNKSELKDKLSFQFNWYYYYATKKEFMDSYSISYDKTKDETPNGLSVKSSRKNIHKGWWEVEVISKIDNKPVSFNSATKFQIYIK